MSDSISEIKFLYKKLSNDSTIKELFETMYTLLNYLDNKGYISELSKIKLLENIKENINIYSQNNTNKMDKKLWTKEISKLFGKVLKLIKKLDSLVIATSCDKIINDFINTKILSFGRFNPLNLGNLNKIIKIKAGRAHMLMLTSDGSVYSVGKNDFGQLGQNKEINNLDHPTRIDKLPKCKKISVGYCTNSCITEKGEIYSWGAGENGRLGLGNEDNVYEPKKVDIDWKCKDIQSGSMFQCAISETFEIYSWGYHCNNGHNTNEDCLTPKKIAIFENRYFKSISIKSSGYHILALSCSGKLFTWGHNRCGQLGIGNNIGNNNKDEGDFYIKSPQLIKSYMINNTIYDITNLEIISIITGWGTSSFLDKEGRVYSCGRNNYEEIGMKLSDSLINPCGQYYFPIFTLVDFLKNEKIVKITSGGEFVSMLTSNNELYIWGDNSENQLEIDDDFIDKTIYSESTNKIIKTKPISNIIDISLSNYTTFIILEDKS